MKITIIIMLLWISIFADNPKTYSLLGDEIYKNAQNFNKLKTKNLYNLEKQNIDIYIAKVNKAKRYGFLVDDNLKNATKAEYLKKLRIIKKLNDKHIAKVHKHFKLAILNNESVFFSQLVNSQLVDIDKYRNEIREYYYAHKDEVVLPPKLEDEFNKNQQVLREKRIKESKHIKDENRIKRIKASDKAKEKKIKKNLEEETDRKKREIEEYQKRELSY